MKQDIKKAFEALDERELGELLKDLSPEALENAACESVTKNACSRAGIVGKQSKRLLHVSRRAIVALAACFAILASLTVGVFALAEEAKEYNEAVAFCMENDIPTDGMTRGEIKEVYRSFKRGERTYDTERPGEPFFTETAAEIGGAVFPAETDAPEEPVEFRPNNRNTIAYGWDNAQHGLCRVEHNGEVSWQYFTDEIDLCWAEETEDGVVFVGWVPGTETPIAIKLDNNGGHLWSRTLGRGEITGVTGEPDGSVTVFAYDEDYDNGTDNRLIVSRIDPAGELVWQNETVTPDPIRICDEVVHYGEGYLAIGHIDDFDGVWNVQRVLSIDAQGNLLGEFSYSADGVDYHLYDIAVYGDKLYISAYVRDNSVFGSLYGNQTWANASVSDEEFTEMVKLAYKAVLLVCDPESCDINVFYEAEGSFCRDLYEDEEGFLCWDVESFYSAKYEPGASNWRTKGKVKMYTCRFDLDGRLVDKLDSGTVRDF